MEHIPETHIRSNLSEEEKENFRKERDYYLMGQGEVINKEMFKTLNKLGREKTQQEIIAIEIANEQSNKLLTKFGLQPFNIPTDNYYILPDEILGFGKNNPAGAFPRYNLCLFRDTEAGLNPVIFGCFAFHETLHLKNYLSFKQQQKNDGLRIYRAGISISTSQKNKGKIPKVYLRGLDEAITTKMNEEYLSILLQHPEFKKEAEWWKSMECNLLKKDYTKDKKIFESEIFWIEPSNKEIFALAHTLERRLLDYICSEIHKKKPDKYPSEKDVFTEFQRAQITGNILTIARDITHTFGKGSFRKIASYPEDWRLKIHFEALKLKRKINKS